MSGAEGMISYLESMLKLNDEKLRVFAKVPLARGESCKCGGLPLLLLTSNSVFGDLPLVMLNYELITDIPFFWGVLFLSSH